MGVAGDFTERQDENAFGDLLPRLTGLPGSGAEGMDTYAAQVAAAITFSARPVPPVRPHELPRNTHAAV
jgi:hypothetical protein